MGMKPETKHTTRKGYFYLAPKSLYEKTPAHTYADIAG
jgi:hypothetical protein